MEVFRRAGRRDHLQIQKVMQQKKIFVTMRHGRKYPCPDKAFPGSGRRCAQGLLQAVCGAAAIPVPCPVRGRRRKMRKLRGASAKGISGAGDGPACRRGGHGPGWACCPRGGVPGGETHGAAQACWAGPCAAVAAVAGDGAAVARRWRVVIPGVIVMHTACPQDEEPGEQDQGQDMQEPDKSGMRTHRHSLVPSRIAPPAKEQKRPRA